MELYKESFWRTYNVSVTSFINVYIKMSVSLFLSRDFSIY